MTSLTKKLNIKILHFEDDDLLSSMYGEKLKMGGFDYVRYNSPSNNPVEVVLKENPNLIIMDIIMPDMDGFTATKILKSNPKIKNIPIIGLCNMQGGKDKAIKVGMTDYFVNSKTSPNKLADKIKRLLAAS